MLPLSIAAALKDSKIELVRQWLSTGPDNEALGHALLRSVGSTQSSLEIVELLAKAGADLNFTYKSYSIVIGPPLFIAAANSSIALAKRLLELGADAAYQKPNGANALYSAVISRMPERAAMIDLLISCGVDPDAGLKEGVAALDEASRRPPFDLVKHFLKAGADQSALGWSPLMRAIALDNVARCRELLRTHPAAAPPDVWERTPFLLAVQTGEVAKAEILVADGANLDDRGRLGNTALMYAAEVNAVAMIEWLVARGADVDAVNDQNWTALMCAASHGAAGAVAALILAGADITLGTGTLQTAMDVATNIETVAALRAAGADVDRVSGDGYNLLKRAAEDGNLEFVRQLLELGADPNRTSLGEDPLHMATYADNVEIMRALLDKGADPNMAEYDGRTPLHSAKSVEAAQLLIERGGDPGREDHFRSPPAATVNSDDVKAFIASAFDTKTQAR